MAAFVRVDHYDVEAAIADEILENSWLANPDEFQDWEVSELIESTLEFVRNEWLRDTLAITPVGEESDQNVGFQA